MNEQPPGPIFEIQVPEELEAGEYANFLSVWHSPWEFTLDFANTQQAQPLDPENPAAGVKVPVRVVSRVKIPPAVIFDVLRTLNENMTRYEQSFGEIGNAAEEVNPEDPS